MTPRPPAVIAVAFLALAMTAPLFSQADKPIDPKELAAVQKIRTRIEERAKTTGTAKPVAYDVTIPNTTVPRRGARAWGVYSPPSSSMRSGCRRMR